MELSTPQTFTRAPQRIREYRYRMKAVTAKHTPSTSPSASLPLLLKPERLPVFPLTVT